MIRTLARDFVRYRFWVALATTCLAEFARLALRLPPRRDALVTIFLSTLFVYNLDHWVDREGEHALPALGLALGAVLALGLVALELPLPTTTLVGGGLLLIVAYLRSTTSEAPRRGALGKPLFVGAAVASAVVLVPLITGLAHAAHGSPRPLALEVACRALVLSLLCAANTLLADLGDTEADRASGAPTLAVVYGGVRTQILATLLAALAFGLATVAYEVGWTRAFDARPGIALASGALVALAWLLPPRTSSLLAKFALDDALVLPLVWLLLGAPPPH